MSETAPVQPVKEKKKGEWVYIILILLLLITNGACGWFWWKDKNMLRVITIEKESVAKDAEIVKQELIGLKAQYESLNVNNKEMQAEINRKKEEITILQQQLEKNKDNEWIIAKLKRETETLRAIMQHFVVEIDSLNTLNKNIIADREKVKGALNTEIEKNNQLSKQNNDLQSTVNMASMLKTVGCAATGIVEKRGGKKEVETKKAKHTDKIKIRFTLAENLVAKKGDRVIFARIVMPDGKEMSQGDDSSHVFSFGRSHGYWATKKTVNYDNENTDVIMYAHIKEGDNYKNGKYIIEIATDGETIGSTTLDLE